MHGSTTSASSPGVAVAPAEASFLAAEAKNPDVWMGLAREPALRHLAEGRVRRASRPSSRRPVRAWGRGRKVVTTSSWYARSTTRPRKATEYACKEQKLKKIGILAVNLPFGTDSAELAKKEAAKCKGCEIVTTQTNGFSDTDLTQQVLAFKDAGIDGIIAFDYPNPFGVFVKQMQDNGLTIPILGGASLGLAVDSKAITDASKLVIIDDCVPAVEKSKTAKTFVKAYEKEFGYTPNYVSGQAYDAVTLAARRSRRSRQDRPRSRRRSPARRRARCAASRTTRTTCWEAV